MPVVNGRLTCCTCGADLGDAEDPYRDPDCSACLNRQEAEAEEQLEMQRLAQAEQDDIDDANEEEWRERDAWYDEHSQYPSDHSEEWSDLQRGYGI